MAMVSLDERERSLLLVSLDLVDERLRCQCPACTGDLPGLGDVAVKRGLEGDVKRRAADRKTTRVDALRLKAKLLEVVDSDDDGGGGDEPAPDAPKPPAEKKAPEGPADRNPTGEELYGGDTTRAREPEPALSEA